MFCTLEVFPTRRGKKFAEKILQEKILQEKIFQEKILHEKIFRWRNFCLKGSCEAKLFHLIIFQLVKKNLLFNTQTQIFITLLIHRNPFHST